MNTSSNTPLPNTPNHTQPNHSHFNLPLLSLSPKEITSENFAEYQNQTRILRERKAAASLAFRLANPK